MRISAKEAFEKANVALSPEKIVDIIFSRISSASETGLKQICIYKDMPCVIGLTAPMNEELFTFGDIYKYIEDLLTNLGYKIDHSLSTITIRWNEIN